MWLRDLRAFLVGPDPQVRPRTRIGRALPTIGVIAAIAAGLITLAYLIDNGPKVSTGFLVIDAVLIAAPLGLVATRPLLAWRIAFIVAGFAGSTVPIQQNTPWPWTPTQMLMFPVLLAVVAVRHRRGVLVWTGLSAALLIVMFVLPGNVAGLLLAVAAILVIGDQVRRRREVQAALAEEEERTELAQARRAVAEERNRIAREMHDVVAHHMSLIAVRAETAVYRIDGVPPAVAEELAAIAGTSREALVEMRRLLGVLRSTETALVEPQPVLDDLAGLVRDARAAGVDVTFDPLPGTRVPPAVGLAAFRIVQEALSNARRHAAGAPVRITLSLGPSTLELHVHNTLTAGVTAITGDRHGLLGMRERATAIGGTFTAGPDDTGGYTVHATLPLEVAA
ncbi:sensor histidine kinase [Dactylosporangium siamense]|uniref:histidine kinase n=1 Tax=Dactylosporangium siamense TaxID=685454 RepID=A0A919U8I6_9ACTN|nr:histidine kinase [Dactylosporangium siamense]GIG42820.1 two-component sensor histidine kinase [Dactylosporangium siamense]